MRRSIRLAPVALLLLVVAMGFGGTASALPSGSCRLHMIGAMQTNRRDSQVLDAALPDGSVVVGSSYTQGKSVIVHLRRVLSDCSVAASFGAVIPVRFGQIDTIAAAPDGRILVGGSYLRSALVGRMFENGGLDRTFGDGGWARVWPHEHVFRGMGRPGFSVTSMAVAPSGAIVLGGTDGGAHCCVRQFVSKLTPDGVPIASFGDDGSRVIPGYAGSYTTEVFVNPDESIYAFGQYEQSGCGDPYIVRLFANGVLDQPFDHAIVRTVKQITRPKTRFTPSLVPDASGGFTLVGGLDRTCAIPSRHQPSGGVSVRIASSGEIVGELTHFVSPHYAFDSPATLRLPSGRVVAAGAGVTSTLVQAFNPDGSRDAAVGDHGLFRVAAAGGTHHDYAGVSLLPAPDGSAWLVTGLSHEIDLTPTGVR